MESPKDRRTELELIQQVREQLCLVEESLHKAKDVASNAHETLQNLQDPIFYAVKTALETLAEVGKAYNAVDTPLLEAKTKLRSLEAALSGKRENPDSGLLSR